MCKLLCEDLFPWFVWVVGFFGEGCNWSMLLQVSLAGKHVSKGQFRNGKGHLPSDPMHECELWTVYFGIPKNSREKSSQALLHEHSWKSLKIYENSGFHGFSMAFPHLHTSKHTVSRTLTRPPPCGLKLHLGAYLLKSSCGDLWRSERSYSGSNFWSFFSIPKREVQSLSSRSCTLKGPTDQLKHPLKGFWLQTSNYKIVSREHAPIWSGFYSINRKNCRSNCQKRYCKKWHTIMGFLYLHL